MNKKRLLTFSIICIAVIVIYFLLNFIATHLFMPAKISLPQKTNDLEISEAQGRYALSSSSPSFGSDPFQSVEVEGWAFLNTTEENDDKEITVILYSVDDPSLCYTIPVEMSSRPDVYNAFAETEEISGLNHGFKACFTPIMLKDGQYQLILCVRENENLCGCLTTSVYFTKDGKLFTEEIS